MPSLPLFKFGPRARSTCWGIALCTMFIVASFSVASGLGTSMDKLSDNFSTDYYLLTMPGETGPEFFSTDSLESVYGHYAVGVVTDVFAVPLNETVTVFSFEDTFSVVGESYYITGDDLLTGTGVPLTGDVILTGAAEVYATVSGKFSSSIFPSTWVMGTMNLVTELTGQTIGRHNFALTEDINASAIAGLEAEGFAVQPLIGIVEFLDSGVSEIQSDTTWVLLPSAFVIAVLAYSFLGSETADRRHDIGIIKTLGAGRKRVLGYLLLNAFVISAYGGMLGIALGVVVSYALSTAASTMFTSVFIIEASELLLVLAFLVTLAAGVLGALIPALRMTYTSPVRDLKEVAPFS